MVPKRIWLRFVYIQIQNLRGGVEIHFRVYKELKKFIVTYFFIFFFFSRPRRLYKYKDGSLQCDLSPVGLEYFSLQIIITSANFKSIQNFSDENKRILKIITKMDNYWIYFSDQRKNRLILFFSTQINTIYQYSISQCLHRNKQWNVSSKLRYTF